MVEASNLVGGIARTENYKGSINSISAAIASSRRSQGYGNLWREICGEDFLTRRRLSRIYYRGKYCAYRLKLLNALVNLGWYEAARILLSYAKWQVFLRRAEESFEQWVINRFGGGSIGIFLEPTLRRCGAFLVVQLPLIGRPNG